MRKKFDREHILSICDKEEGTVLSLKSQVAVNELCDYFLGDDWYDDSGVLDPEQVNLRIVCEIEKRYKGCKYKK